jgi:polar amino acid transport system substrate-binding protein
MKMRPWTAAPLLASALAMVPMAALAGEGIVVGVDFVVPEYKGGDKFRSPATIDTALAEDLAKRLQVPLQTVPAQAAADAASARDAQALRLTSLRDLSVVPKDMTVVPIDYRAVPMAIMRSDTTIKRWEQLQGRKVCIAAGGNHVGTLSGRYGAVEQVHPSPTDALVALREGTCDAMVHDSTMLDELIRYPEWKKFSARLRGNQRSTLAFLVPAHDQARVSTLRRVAFDWDAKGYPEQLVKKVVRDIAFEVYLEQDVPDCH